MNKQKRSQQKTCDIPRQVLKDGKDIGHIDGIRKEQNCMILYTIRSVEQVAIQTSAF